MIGDYCLAGLKLMRGYSQAIKNRSRFDHAGRQNRVAFVTACNSFVLTIPSGPCQPPSARRSFTLSQDAAPRCARLVTRRETQDPDRGPDPAPTRSSPPCFSALRPAAFQSRSFYTLPIVPAPPVSRPGCVSRPCGDVPG
ncbi:hypothetical protein E2C01_057841 [Portunus trituberculatus]|uniref:Uncharacterized protein n=1 Tax=Portunus trituberculatus TaxID=210409 RepID=A0A5B7H1G1_PORTR|nr:hypothetical protein [Portunus trituberculatus]